MGSTTIIMVKNKNILFKGYYGFSNIGDDVFVLTANWWCEKYLDKYKPIFIGKELPINIEGIRVSNKLRRYIELYYLFNSKNIIFFGGSLFNNQISVLDIRNIISKNDKLINKTMAFGVSIGPFVNQKDKLNNIKLLSAFNKVFVRDYSSFVMNSSKFNYSSDPALLLGEIFPKLMGRKNNNLGLNIGSFSSSSNNIKTIIKLLKKEDIYKRYSCIKCFVFNKNDFENTQLMVKKLNEQKLNINIEIIQYTNNTKNFLEEYSKCRVVIGERLHSAIIAMSFNIPFILFEYHKKCTDFLKEIDYGINNEEKMKSILQSPEDYVSKIDGIRKEKCDILLCDLKRMAEEVKCQN